MHCVIKLLMVWSQLQAVPHVVLLEPTAPCTVTQSIASISSCHLAH